MDEGRFQRVKDLFDTLVELSADERERLLSHSREHGEATCSYVAGLLEADALLANSTARPLLACPDRASVELLPEENRNRIGTQIGAFTILRELGHGGMGSVYLAQRADDSVAQRVAIKIVRPGRLDTATLARFRVERQVLALFNHPNIASLIDLGELEDGAPYVIMEYVEGVPITDHANSVNCTLAQRLDLFLQVCDAVLHAHRNLVLHRDIKPSNVLVDAEGRPKLIDFGIAKPLEAHIGVAGYEETKTRKQFFSIGNVAPEYLTAGISGIPSDVYSLGVLLYELLAGVKPYTFDGLGLAQIEQQIVEVDPCPPSVRLEAGFQGHKWDVDVSGMVRARELRGDLDSIVMRCLRKRAKDRYDSVAELVNDVERYRTGFPVLARRGGWMYRARRFSRRNRTVLSGAVGALVIGLAFSATYFVQRTSTVEQRDRADQLTSVMRSALGSADPEFALGKNVSAREVFERIAIEAEHSAELEPKSRATLLGSVAEITLHIGEPQQALHLLDSLDTSSLDNRARDEIARLHARTLLALGDTIAARRLLAKRDVDAGDEGSLAQWDLLNATIRFQEADFEGAARVCDALERRAPTVEVREKALLLKARANERLDKWDDALSLYQQVLNGQYARLPRNHPAILRTLLDLAHLAAYTGKMANIGDPTTEALRVGESLYGRHSLGFLEILKVRRDIFGKDSRHKEEREVQFEIVSLVDDLIGRDTPVAIEEYMRLAEVTRQLAIVSNQPTLSAEATQLYRKAIDAAQRAFPSDDLRLFKYRTVFGIHLVRLYDFREAIDLLSSAIRSVEQNPAAKQGPLDNLAKLARDICVYAEDRTDANRQVLLQSIEVNRESAISYPAKVATRALESVARRLEVELPPIGPLVAGADRTLTESAIPLGLRSRIVEK